MMAGRTRPTRRAALALAVLCCMTAATRANANEESGMLSLTAAEPALLHTALRYPKFYGDSETTSGGLRERSHLLGSLGGFRDTLIDSGVYANVSVTQFVHGNLSGGREKSDAPRTNGSIDYWAWLDTGKAGLWPAGVIFLHGESSWAARPSVNNDVQSKLSANTDATMPDPKQSATALSEAYLLQGLPWNLLGAVGKIDLAAWADTNTFANNERTQFQYAGLVNNALVGSFIPYTALSGFLSWSPSKQHSLVGVFSQTDGAATTDGFDTLFNGNNTFAAQYRFSPSIGNRPGNYLAVALYTSKDSEDFRVSRRHLVTDTTDAAQTGKKPDNYALLLGFDQYLWVDDESAREVVERHKTSAHNSLHRHHNPPIGVGVFGRAGFNPEDRNVIQQFYSFGVSGTGVPVLERYDDTWGIGWSGSRISGDLRDVDDGLRSFEHAAEVYYNVAIVPAASLTANGQAIRPANDAHSTAYAAGLRLQVDF